MKLTLLTSLFWDFADLIVPRLCPVCGQRLVACERLVCGSCLVQLPYTQIKDFKDNAVVRTFFAKIPVERAYSHLAYGKESLTHPLIMKLKYHHRPDIGEKAGRWMATELKDKGFFEGVDGIVPVPLHWMRLLKRGYNQSMQLAKGVSEVTGIPVRTNVVRRTRNNSSQTKVGNETARKENVRGIFRARRTSLSHILLVDDVMTTGATTTECALTILAENPGMRFSVITMAKVMV